MHNIATSIPAAASLIGWWRDAGVDDFVDEVALPWLDRNRSERTATVSRPTASAADAPLPATLTALTQWLVSDAAIPEAGPVARRIAASGDPASRLMILIDMPEADDHRTGHLLSGDCAALFDNMLAAIGHSRASVYVAALCPGRPPTAMLAENALPRLAEIARHHIALAAPERLWLMGRTVSRAILAMDDIAARGTLHDVNHQGGTVTAVASFAPRFLLQNPAQKPGAWADMQMLIRGN